MGGKMAKGDKKGALYAMKRKKLYEQEMAKIQNVRFTLETQVINLESAQQNAQTYSALKQGNTAMQGIQKKLGSNKSTMSWTKSKRKWKWLKKSTTRSLNPSIRSWPTK